MPNSNSEVDPLVVKISKNHESHLYVSLDLYYEVKQIIESGLTKISFSIIFAALILGLLLRHA